jgi:phage-related minor tail protein
MTEERRVQLVAEVDTTRTRAGFQEIGQQAGQMAQQVTQAGERAERAVAGVGSGASTSSRNVDAASRSIIGSIQRTTAAMESGGRATAQYYEVLARQRGIDPNTLTPYLAQLRAVEQAQANAAHTAAEQQAAQTRAAEAARAAAAAQRELAQAQATRDNFVASLQDQVNAIGRTRVELLELRAAQLGVSDHAAPFIARLREAEGGLTRTGVSAAQTANALRQVPMQFTDIVTSLQAGQAPLTVLLQQGGQLRDTFGSTGAAARALGGYVVGLINPYTVAAAAAVALALAYKAGAEEASGYARAIAVTGNAAGATVDQLSQAARQIAAVSGSQGAAAEALNALVSTGQVSAENLQRFGAVAVDVQKVIGRSVADTAAEFAELGRAPLAALDKINEKYHFITAATYAQVKALQDQGRAQEAADVAQKAYADGIDRQRQKVLDALTDWERGWIRIKGAVSGAVDSVIDFAGGREASNFDKINGLLDDRAKIEESLSRARKRNLPADIAVYEAELDANKRAINAIRDKDGAARAAAKAEADAAQITQARNKWLDDGNKFLSRQAQLERDLERARNEGKAAFADKSPAAREELIAKRLADIRKSYSDLYNAGIESNIAALKRRDQVADVVQQRELARIQTQRALGDMSETQAINATADAEIKAFDRKEKLLQAELAQIKLKANSQKEQADLEGQLDVLDEQRASRKQQRENDLALLLDRRRQLSDALDRSGIVAATAERDGLIAQVEAQFQYNQEIGLSTTQVAELRAARLQNAAALKEEAAAAQDAIPGGEELAKLYREQAQALRDLGDAQTRGSYKDQMVTQWRLAVDQYGQVFQQGFADMLNNGMDGWKSFTRSLVTTFKTTVADSIYKMFARPIVVQLVGSYLGVSQTAIAGEIAGQPNAYGVTNDSTNPISAAQAASSMYKAITGGLSGIPDLIAGGVQKGMTAAGYNPLASQGYATASGQALTPTAYWAGQVGGTLAGYGIGSTLNSAISGKYETGSGVMTAEKIGTAVASAIFGPIGGAVAGAISGLANRAFGMGPKEIRDQGISGTLSASSLTGQSYSAWHQDGGWFRSDKNGTDTKALTDAMVKQFTQGLAAIESASSGFAMSLGVQADWIKDYSKVFDLKLTGDASKDQQAVTDFFSGIGDEIAKKLVPNLGELSKSGETASAALERLATDFRGTDQIAQLLGFSASQLFGEAGIGSAKAREQLIDMAGGLSALSSQAAFFNQNFLTDAERIKPVAEALDKALSSLGLSTIPATRDEFKALVNSLITSGAAPTESGAKQLDSLLALAEAFAQVHPAADAAAEAVDKAAAAMQAVKDAASTMFAGVNDAYSALQKVVSREKSAIQSSVDSHTAALNKLKSLSQSLRSTLDSLKSPDQKVAERAFGQAQIRAALAIAKAGGPLPDADSLKDALSAVTQDASSQFSSYTDYLRDLYQTQADIAQLGDLTDDQLTVEQRSLDALQEQIKRLDDIVANGQAQIDALNGQSVATLTLAQAMAAFQSSIGSAQSNPVVGGTATIAGFYQDLLGRAPDQAGLQYWQGVLAKGESLDAIRLGFMSSQEYKDHQRKLGIPGFASGGLFRGGLRIVGENGPELEATGPSRIWSSNQTAALLARAGGGDSAALVAEIKALRDEVRQFKEANSAENRGIAKGTQQAGEALEKWDATGMPAERTA